MVEVCARVAADVLVQWRESSGRPEWRERPGESGRVRTQDPGSPEARPPPQSQTTRRQEFFRDEPDDTGAEEKQEEALLADVSVFVDMETPLRRRDVRLSDEPEKARALDVNFTSWGTSFGPGESKKRGRAP
ncbi:hypothetical protein RUM43_006221 [Polyplax serrata]|uniref:Uncharacterized protein n=1 Tax=Polyplax serrata TaxID=468196 RepID=A0AAN8NRM3_POLSC